MNRWVSGAIIALIVLGSTTTSAHVILNHFYGERHISTSTQTILIENFGQQVTTGDVRYDVEEYMLHENKYHLKILPEGHEVAATSLWLSKEAYEEAQETGNPVTISSTTTTETKPIDTLPIAAILGIAAGIMTLVVWIGYRRAWGDVASIFLERGLRDATIKDIEIAGYAMEFGEFTIPELMRRTKESKLTVWRSVQKLIEHGLVQLTERTRPSANGLGGRGKPSRVYRYSGEKSLKFRR